MSYRRKERTKVRPCPRSRSSFHPAIWSPTGATNGRWIICSAAMRPRPPIFLTQVVETAPGFATAWFALASIREATGDRDGAIAAFAAARDADREDYHGARLHLARLGVGEATPAMTGVYVRRLFDQHAPDFDQALVERLDYRGPELLLEAVRPSQGQRFRLRLGARSRLRHRPRRCGVPALLRLAGRRRHFSGHGRAGARQGTVRPPRGRGPDGVSCRRSRRAAPLALAADVFVYCSDLAPIAAAVAGVLAPGGLFAFTVETHDDPGVRLQETLRYAHGPAHVRAAIAGGWAATSATHRGLDPDREGRARCRACWW